MQNKRLRILGIVAVIGGVVLGFSGTVYANTSTSPNYKVIETQFGGGSSLESCSGQYCAQVSIGDVADGEIPVTTANFNDVLGDEPVLEVIIEAGASDLGVLTTEKTATKTTVVKVRHHLSGGYFLQVVGTPPSFEGYTLKAMDQPSASQPGVEQFGINVVENTQPAMGRNPGQQPQDGIFGVVEAAYAVPNQFLYINEDVIARSVTDSGRTDYTISMIVNIANSTPPGSYSADFSAIVIPMY